MFTYSYIRNSNLISQVSGPILNQYSTITHPQSSLVNPTYDFDGNATAYPLPAAPAANSTLVWDGENRLISSTVNGVTTTQQFDTMGRRISKTTC